MTIYKKIMNVQSELKAPKGNYNSFGKYSYRSAEDILEAVKPLLKKEGLAISITDDIVMIGDRFYVKSTVKLIDIENGDVVETSALAREDETKKGMDLAQVTGSCSSYSRKYALNGAFAIDSSELDPDRVNTHGQEVQQDKPKSTTTASNGISEAQAKRLIAIGYKANITTEQILSTIKKEYNVSEIKALNKTQYDAICNRLEAKIK